MDLSSVTEAAQEKNCTGQTIRNAVERGDLTAIKLGRAIYVRTSTRKWERWEPNEQQAKNARK